MRYIDSVKFLKTRMCIIQRICKIMLSSNICFMLLILDKFTQKHNLHFKSDKNLGAIQHIFTVLDTRDISVHGGK